VKIIERVQAHYESREMPFGKTYEWHPAYVFLECGCGKRWTIDAKSAITPANVAVILPTSSPETSRMEKLLFRRSSAVRGSMMPESGHNNTSVTRRHILKARPGVTTILRRPPTGSKQKEKNSLMRAEQTVSEMAQETLLRQARTLTQRTGGPFVEALEAVVETPAGRQLEELRCGAHQGEEARYWQANLRFARVSEQAGHPLHPV
jgi:hypothetical protein